MLAFDEIAGLVNDGIRYEDMGDEEVVGGYMAENNPSFGNTPVSIHGGAGGSGAGGGGDRGGGGGHGRSYKTSDDENSEEVRGTDKIFKNKHLN